MSIHHIPEKRRQNPASLTFARLKIIALFADKDVEGKQMLSILVVIACCVVGALLLSVRVKIGPIGKLGLIALFTLCGVFLRSPYLMGKVVEPYLPTSRSKQLERSLEAIYIFHLSGGRVNLVVDYKKATAEIKSAAAAGLRRLGDDDQIQRAKLIMKLVKFGGDSLCGAFFIGDIDPQQLTDALKQLTDEDFENWARLSVTALKLELLAAPYSKVSTFSFYDSFDHIQASSVEADRDFLKKKFTDLSANRPVPPKEACRATEILYAGIIKTGIPAGPHFMRYQAEPSPGVRNPVSANPDRPVDKNATTIQLTKSQMSSITHDLQK